MNATPNTAMTNKDRVQDAIKTKTETCDQCFPKKEEEECAECGDAVGIWWEEEGEVFCKECNTSCDGCAVEKCNVCRKEEEEADDDSDDE